jgi:hypothetical protein
MICKVTDAGRKDEFRAEKKTEFAGDMVWVPQKKTIT